MKQDSYYRKLDEIIDLFEEAEGLIKEAEIVRKELIIPSINELRYAGYHITKYIRYGII